MNISDRGGDRSATRELISANFTALRVKRNVLKNSNIGVLFVNSQGGISEYNRAIGLDGGFLLGQHVTMTGLLAKTFAASDTRQGRRRCRRLRAGRTIASTTAGNTSTSANSSMPRWATSHGSTSVQARRRAMDAAAAAGEAFARSFNANADYYENHAGVVDSRTQNFYGNMSRQDTSAL